LFVLQDLVDSAVTAQQLEDSLDDLASGVQAATKLGQALEAEAAVAVANEVVDLAEATEVHPHAPCSIRHAAVVRVRGRGLGFSGWG